MGKGVDPYVCIYVNLLRCGKRCGSRSELLCELLLQALGSRSLFAVTFPSRANSSPLLVGRAAHHILGRSLSSKINALRTPLSFLQAGLRTACLAAALSLNKTLRSLDLGGWTWDELGNGCALPFLTLGCCPGTALTCVKVWGWDGGGGGGARQAVVNGCALPFH